MTTMRTGLVTVLVLSWAIPSAADSDGNFCVGPDYLAYQLHFSTAPYSHRLYVMRFDDAARWKEPARIDLPAFNAPPMRCEPRRVALAGWDAIHHVTWSEDDPTRLSLRVEPKPPGPADMRAFPDAIASLVLGVPGASDTYSLRLPSPDPARGYVLQVSRVRDPVRRCVVRVRASVLQYVADAVIDAHELFAGEMPAECGD